MARQVVKPINLPNQPPLNLFHWIASLGIQYLLTLCDKLRSTDSWVIHPWVKQFEGTIQIEAGLRGPQKKIEQLLSNVTGLVTENYAVDLLFKSHDGLPPAA